MSDNVYLRELTPGGLTYEDLDWLRKHLKQRALEQQGILAIRMSPGARQKTRDSAPSAAAKLAATKALLERLENTMETLV